MQVTANTTSSLFSRFLSAARAALSLHVAVSAFSIFIPGEGAMGDYATIEQAETALHALPLSAQQKATICDADGYCVCR